MIKSYLKNQFPLIFTGVLWASFAAYCIIVPNMSEYAVLCAAASGVMFIWSIIRQCIMNKEDNT